jgi:pimeloyl-ACP methyl ester carboxylesterase
LKTIKTSDFWLYQYKKKDDKMDNSPFPFKSQQGKEKFMAAYDALLRNWPVPYESFDIPGRYGCTHVIVSGPQDAPALVLLHGAQATLTMWSANIADLSHEYRVYAVDVIGQPGKSIPNPAFTKRDDLIPWFTELLDTLKIGRANLVGMSYGGWFSLNYAIHMPERVNKLALLSPAASFLPLVGQHLLRIMLMHFFPSRMTVRSFKLWETYPDNIKSPENQARFNKYLDLMILGFKYFRIQGQSNPDIFSDDQLRSVRAPVLLLIGQQEVIYDPAASVERARRLIPHIEADLIPQASHDMTSYRAGIVDQRILRFLKDKG